jgi:hypothetical protein
LIVPLVGGICRSSGDLAEIGRLLRVVPRLGRTPIAHRDSRAVALFLSVNSVND